jgi:hypothetical protein
MLRFPADPVGCIMNANSSMTDTTSMSALVAPEDLRCGDYVAVLNEIVEFPTFLWSLSVPGERDELVRIRFVPTGSGLPLRIKAICLPFVFVTSPLGQGQSIDVRQVQLVRLKEGYAKTVRRSLRKQLARLTCLRNKK